MLNLPQIENTPKVKYTHPNETVNITTLEELKLGCSELEKNHFIKLLPTPGIANAALNQEDLAEYKDLQVEARFENSVQYKFLTEDGDNAIAIRDGRLEAISTKFKEVNGRITISYTYDDLGRIRHRETFIAGNSYSETFKYKSDAPNEEGVYEFDVTIVHSPGFR